jgi:hypothetical protein
MPPIRLLILACLILAPSQAMAQSASPNASYLAPPIEDMIALVELQRAEELQALHDEGVNLRAADGGTLTAAHLSELQTKLDQLDASYRRRLRGYDPLIVDALGRRR